MANVPDWLQEAAPGTRVAVGSSRGSYQEGEFVRMQRDWVVVRFEGGALVGAAYEAPFLPSEVFPLTDEIRATIAGAARADEDRRLWRQGERLFRGEFPLTEDQRSRLLAVLREVCRG